MKRAIAGVATPRAPARDREARGRGDRMPASFRRGRASACSATVARAPAVPRSRERRRVAVDPRAGRRTRPVRGQPTAGPGERSPACDRRAAAHHAHQDASLTAHRSHPRSSGGTFLFWDFGVRSDRRRRSDSFASRAMPRSRVTPRAHALGFCRDRIAHPGTGRSRSVASCAVKAVTWAFAKRSEALACCDVLVTSDWIRPNTRRWRSVTGAG